MEKKFLENLAELKFRCRAPGCNQQVVMLASYCYYHLRKGMISTTEVKPDEELTEMIKQALQRDDIKLALCKKSRAYFGVTTVPAKRLEGHLNESGCDYFRILFKCENKKEGSRAEMLTIGIVTGDPETAPIVANRMGGGNTVEESTPESEAFVYVVCDSEGKRRPAEKDGVPDPNKPDFSDGNLPLEEIKKLARECAEKIVEIFLEYGTDKIPYVVV